MYTFTVYKTDRWQESAVLHRELSSVLCDELWRWGEGWREAQEARDICIFRLIISLYSRNQHTILKQLYANEKQKKPSSVGSSVLKPSFIFLKEHWSSFLLCSLLMQVLMIAFFHYNHLVRYFSPTLDMCSLKLMSCFFFNLHHFQGLVLKRVSSNNSYYSGSNHYKWKDSDLNNHYSGLIK